MQHAQSIYKSSYSFNDWNENNPNPVPNEFCTEENLEQSIKYISQELRILGLPLIYTNASISYDSINCDIIKFLNAAYELLREIKALSSSKDDLESRNKNLISDLQAVNKKNTLLKDNLEQQERKFRNAVENERQMKLKKEQLAHQIKSEKEESKKLLSQIQQQKSVHQHEIRKYENKLNQMTAKLNQILTDKNSDKKVSSFSVSHALKRNTKQRGKWKTEATEKSSIEEMYTSVISAYENNSSKMVEEISQLNKCLEQIQGKVLEMLHSSKDNKSSKDLNQHDMIPLKILLTKPNKDGVVEHFQSLLGQLEVNTLNMMNTIENKSDENLCLKSEVSRLRAFLQECKSKKLIESDEEFISSETLKNNPCMCPKSFLIQEQCQTEKNKLEEEKLKLSNAIAEIQKEKTEIEVQKVNLIRSTMSLSKSQYGQAIPSFPIMTTKDGITAVPSLSVHQNILQNDGQTLDPVTPLWRMNLLADSVQDLNIENNECSANSSLPSTSKDILPVADLPNWLMSAIQSSTGDTQQFDDPENMNQSLQDEKHNQSSEEQNLNLLRAAANDIESRRIQWGL